MANLVFAADVRALVDTKLTDEQLDDIIAQCEDDVTMRFGEHYSETDGTPNTVAETVEGGKPSLFLRRRIQSISSIVEDSITLAASSYRLWGRQGRVERLSEGGKWGKVVTVTYVPVNDNARRKNVIIELVRITLSRTTLQSESIGGEYSYSTRGESPEELCATQMRRLQLGAGL
ncbi:MAG: hypothetical protein HZB51_34190 [Chloroflexi bacterium]|nr:hypothetical protein [Chloroflexota bacterium]